MQAGKVQLIMEVIHDALDKGFIPVEILFIADSMLMVTPSPIGSRGSPLGTGVPLR
jgi:hypothetical protein